MFAEGEKKWTGVLAGVMMETVHYYEVSCWVDIDGGTQSGNEHRRA
jgi:hypothetical protein